MQKKTFEKKITLFITKALNKQEITVNTLKVVNGIYEKPTTNIILNGESVNYFI